MDVLYPFLQQHHLAVDVCVVTVVVAALHRNYVHRFFTIGAGCSGAGPRVAVARAQKQPETGAIFVTGADSGMGEARSAGIYDDRSASKLAAALKAHSPEAAKRCVPVALDVCSDESVALAAKRVEADLASGANGAKGLVAVVQCAGMGYNGPGEFIPMDIYKKQMDVNFFGYVRVVQAMMPHVRAGVKAVGRRGRMVFTGTGGGVLTPVPPLLTAYMSSKFAVEAFVRSFRVEMQLTEKPIDACIISPGFVKPTMLAGRPLHGYKVGPDSRATPVAGLLPVPLQDFVMKAQVYGRQGKL
ncbi:hypothetical protein JL721_9520 [Aureococcus anophagefferens]|nr:hypothetical protein JL721_9520 [Aureococcus anophagefferens]